MFFFLPLKIVLSSCCTGNTVSNLIMILPPIYGAIQTYKDGLEFRYVCSFLGLAGKKSNPCVSVKYFERKDVGAVHRQDPVLFL